MTEAAPLQPPAATEHLVLSAPEPVKPVATTQAPAMAPRVDEAAIPGLDQKVTSYLDALMASDSTRIARYGKRLRSFRETLESADEHGKDPFDVAEVIIEALNTDKPDTRYVVGAGGRIATALRPLIPDRLADKLGERVT